MYIPDWFIVLVALLPLTPIILTIILMVWGMRRRKKGKPWVWFVVLPLFGLAAMSLTSTAKHLTKKAQVERPLIVPPSGSLEPGPVLWVQANHDYCDELCEDVIRAGLVSDLYIAKGGWGVWAPDPADPVLSLRTREVFKVDMSKPRDRSAMPPVGPQEAARIRYVLYSGSATLMARADPDTWQSAVEKGLIDEGVVLYDMRGRGQFDPANTPRLYQAGHGRSYYQPWPIVSSLAFNRRAVGLPSRDALTQRLHDAVMR